MRPPQEIGATLLASLVAFAVGAVSCAEGVPIGPAPGDNGAGGGGASHAGPTNVAGQSASFGASGVSANNTNGEGGSGGASGSGGDGGAFDAAATTVDSEGSAGGGDDGGDGEGSDGVAGQSPVEAGVDAKPDAPAIPTGPAAYWKLDESTGTTAADSSGHNHTAAIVGATWVTGKVGTHAASFNGTSAYAEATGAVVDTSKPYTVAAWVQLTTVSGFRTAVSIDGASVSAFFLQLRGDSGVRFGLSALASDAPGPATIAIAQATPIANTWYHLAGVFDGASLKLYVNGALQDTKPFASAWKGSGSTAIGRGFYTGARADFWPGLIDDVRLYGSALSATEILALATP